VHTDLPALQGLLVHPLAPALGLRRGQRLARAGREVLGPGPALHASLRVPVVGRGARTVHGVPGVSASLGSSSRVGGLAWSRLTSYTREPSLVSATRAKVCDSLNAVARRASEPMREPGQIT